MNSVCITNDVGGTQDLPVGLYRVQVLKCWYDYETGHRCIGRLLDAEAIEIARKAGTTGFKPDDYRKYRKKELSERVRRAAQEFDPTTVYFSLEDFVPDL